jgi:DNA recombination protein RmuC
MVNLGRKLDSSKKFYEESMKKLSLGNGNLIHRVEDLKKLGAKTNKSIDPSLIKRSEDQASLFD